MAENPRKPSNKKTDGLTTKQRQVADLLASGIKIAKASRDADVPERTIHNWKLKPEFADYVAEAKARKIDELRNLLPAIGEHAMATIAKACMGEKVSIASINAAELVLKQIGVIGDIYKDSAIEELDFIWSDTSEREDQKTVIDRQIHLTDEKQEPKDISNEGKTDSNDS